MSRLIDVAAILDSMAKTLAGTEQGEACAFAVRLMRERESATPAKHPDTERLDLLDQIPSGFGWNVDLAGIRLTLSRKDSDLDMYDSIRSAIDAATGRNRS